MLCGRNLKIKFKNQIQILKDARSVKKVGVERVKTAACKCTIIAVVGHNYILYVKYNVLLDSVYGYVMSKIFYEVNILKFTDNSQLQT